MVPTPNERRVHQSPERAEDRARSVRSSKPTATRTSRLAKRRVRGGQKDAQDTLRQTGQTFGKGGAGGPARRKM